MGFNFSKLAPCQGKSLDGNVLSGDFTLTLMGYTTDRISYNADATTVKKRLEDLKVVGVVDVVRKQLTPELSFEWTVRFTSNPGCYPAGAGEIEAMTVNKAGLLGTGNKLTIK